MGTLASRVEKWVWPAIYIGLLLGALGLAVRRSDASLGWGLAGIGAVLIAIGIVLIWVRSRIKDSKETP